MGRKGAGITVKVRKRFKNESNFANMSYFACGNVILEDNEIDVVAWGGNGTGCQRAGRQIWGNLMIAAPDYHCDMETGKHTRKLGTCEIADILQILFDWTQDDDASGWIKRQICTLVYVESLLSRGLVEVEWYDWW